jgi:tRNA-2-methylthio-N6-dimethylallyladenosine synthase
LLYAIAANNNICNSIHLPVQSGSSRILRLMNRKYTREDYLNRIEAIKSIIPGCGISTDIISGFPGETEVDHQATLSLMKQVAYDFAYMFKYSERPGTFAAKKLKDDVRDEVKTERLQEIIALQQELSNNSNKNDMGKVFKVLVEGVSKRSAEQLNGRSSSNKVIVFPRKTFTKRDYVNVKVTGYTAATLLGEPV